MTARFVLKQATQAAHEWVDQIFARHDLANRSDYGRFLIAQAAALVPLEAELTKAGAGRMVERWTDHCRAPLLLADLIALGLSPPAPLIPPEIADEPELAGALYVLEGSRLGGAVLAKRVPPSFPAAFLNASQAPGRWTRFAASLDHLLNTPPKLAAATATALAVFACFEQAATEAL